MASESHFDVHVKGCAATAFEISQARGRVAEARRVLLETDDHLRQIRKVYRALDLHPVLPSPRTSTALAAPRPVMHTPMAAHGERPPSTELRALGDASNNVFSLAAQYSVAALEVASQGSSTTRTFTPMPTMESYVHRVVSELPVSVVAEDALTFVAAWRKEDGKRTPLEDLINDCSEARCNLEIEEQGSRDRLRQLLLTVWEQMERFVLMGEYNKFVVFCVHQEPVWRQAARQLRREQGAQLKTAADIFARFYMEEAAWTEKKLMFQEAAGFLSQCFAELEQQRFSQARAAERHRGLQSACQMAPLPFGHRSHPQHLQSYNDGNAACAAADSTPLRAQRPRGDPSHGCFGKHKARATKNAGPLFAVEVGLHTQRGHAGI
ncbi:hypothetical protein LSCM1_03483 [Leishmania martiniquensis]|uniref:Uncharacterized protein n=1 Tax=Leishmania martiniquensis TaxID=1580590 RepID=A0A836KLV6_9TRYP|nr:hypothetical protein LSCM1_03483 [Leishmania martiniquensis]